jgi:hypothetical protein
VRSLSLLVDRVYRLRIRRLNSLPVSRPKNLFGAFQLRRP